MIQLSIFHQTFYECVCIYWKMIHTCLNSILSVCERIFILNIMLWHLRYFKIPRKNRLYELTFTFYNDVSLKSYFDPSKLFILSLLLWIFNLTQKLWRWCLFRQPTFPKTLRHFLAWWRCGDARARVWRLTQNVPRERERPGLNIGREWAEDRAPGTPSWAEETLGRDGSHGWIQRYNYTNV